MNLPIELNPVTKFNINGSALDSITDPRATIQMNVHQPIQFVQNHF